MNTMNFLRRLLAVLVLLAPATAALAQWELDTTRSSVNFISIKNASVAEVHSFGSVLGYIGADGAVQLDIGLDSVATLIEVRDERMRELLFETAAFPTARMTARVEAGILAMVEEGGTVMTDLPVTLSLHGLEQVLSVPVVVIGEGNGSLQVFTPHPVIINAADFGLGAGIAALQKIAGLQSISSAVPVTVHLVFGHVD